MQVVQGEKWGRASRDGAAQGFPIQIQPIQNVILLLIKKIVSSLSTEWNNFCQFIFPCRYGTEDGCVQNGARGHGTECIHVYTKGRISQYFPFCSIFPDHIITKQQYSIHSPNLLSDLFTKIWNEISQLNHHPLLLIKCNGTVKSTQTIMPWKAYDVRKFLVLCIFIYLTHQR